MNASSSSVSTEVLLDAVSAHIYQHREFLLVRLLLSLLAYCIPLTCVVCVVCCHLHRHNSRRSARGHTPQSVTAHRVKTPVEERPLVPATTNAQASRHGGGRK